MSVEQVATQVVEAVVVLPGDTLVVSLPSARDLSEVDRYAEMIKSKLGDDVKVLVLGGAIGIHVLRPAEVAS